MRAVVPDRRDDDDAAGRGLPHFVDEGGIRPVRAADAQVQDVDAPEDRVVEGVNEPRCVGVLLGVEPPAGTYGAFAIKRFWTPFLRPFRDRFGPSFGVLVPVSGILASRRRKRGKNDVKWARNGLKKVGPMTD